MKNLVSPTKRRIDPLSIYIKPESLIDNFKVKIMSSGSCFASATSEHFQQLGISSYFDVRTCFRFSARSFADYFSYLQSEEPNKIESRLYTSGVEPYQLIRSTIHAEIADTPQNKSRICDEIRKVDEAFIHNLKTADIVIFTLGTSIYLRSNATKQVMNTNEGFVKNSYEIVTPDSQELNTDICSIVENICKLSKESARVFFTVSPQRYSWVPMGDFRNGRDEISGDDAPIPNDGLVNNCYDKSRMRVLLQDAIVDFAKVYPKIKYFPSYEMVMDELRHLENFGIRDGDFGHVSPDTSSHVINRFLNAYLSTPMQEFLEKYKKDESMLLHRFLYHNTTDYTDTIKKHMELLESYRSLHIPMQYVNKVRASIDNHYKKLDSNTAAKALQLKDELMHLVDQNVGVAIREKCKAIDKLDDQTLIFIYGTGETAEEILKNSTALRKRLGGFIQSARKSFDTYYGYSVSNIDEIQISADAKYVVASLGSADKIIENLKNKGVAITQII